VRDKHKRGRRLPISKVVPPHYAFQIKVPYIGNASPSTLRSGHVVPCAREACVVTVQIHTGLVKKKAGPKDKNIRTKINGKFNDVSSKVKKKGKVVPVLN
jgi:hypothetical protein